MTDIIVGVDGSDGAAHALQWAVDEARLHRHTVTAVLVWGLLNQRHRDLEERFDPDYGESDALDSLRHYVRRALGDAAAKGVELQVRNDMPTQALIEAAAGTSLLVLGGRGLGGLKGQLLGSVSYQCLHHAPCPVAIVREGQQPTLVHGDGQRIVVGVDGSPTARRALEWAVAEAAARDAVLQVVHGWHLAYAGGGAYGVLPVDPDLFKEAAEATVDKVIDEVGLTGLRRPVERTVVCASPAAAILEAGEGADLIVMGTRGLGGFAGLVVGSATTQVVHHAACPVVVIPPSG